jgi:hypothetical protein
MKIINKNIIISAFVLMTTISHSQNNFDTIFQLIPKGFDNERYLIGSFSSNDHIDYELNTIDIKDSQTLPLKESISYKQLLESGIKSMMLEYKNYKSNSVITAYAIFALGNYSVITESLLAIINELILPNQLFLKSIYEWIKPTYVKTFNSLTVEEQELFLGKLQLAENFVWFVLIKKNENKYNQWIDSMKIKNGITGDKETYDDEKIKGFFRRRIDKKQWTTEDCMFWILQLKNDFTPLLKNKEITTSHFQFIKQIDTKHAIVVNYIGQYFVVNRDYDVETTKPYAYINIKKPNALIAYRSFNNMDYQIISMANNGDLVFPLKDEWSSFYYLTDSAIYFEKNIKVKDNYFDEMPEMASLINLRVQGIFNEKNNKVMLDSCKSIFYVKNSKIILAQKIDNYFYLYNYSGELVCNDKINIEENRVETIDENGDSKVDTVYKFPFVFSNDNSLIIVVNKKGKKGCVNSAGKLIVPIIYETMVFSDKKNEIIAQETKSGKKIRFDFEGKFISK